jgi:hypothetical protein
MLARNPGDIDTTEHAGNFLNPACHLKRHNR